MRIISHQWGIREAKTILTTERKAKKPMMATSAEWRCEAILRRFIAPFGSAFCAGAH